MKPKSTNEPKLVLNPFKSGDNFREWAVSFVRILQATGRPYYPVLLARKVGGIDVPTDPTTLLQLQMNLFHFLCECLKTNPVTRQITSPYELRTLSLGPDEENPAIEVADIWKKLLVYYDGVATIDLHKALDKFDEFQLMKGESLQQAISRFEDLIIKLCTMHSMKTEFEKRRKFVKALPNDGKWASLQYELHRSNCVSTSNFSKRSKCVSTSDSDSQCSR